MAEAVVPSDNSVTVEVSASAPVIPENASEPVLRLTLKKPKKKNKKKVGWTTDTIDNENMNKLKSKCCCIYEKPHKFGESSSDTDDECDHCRGHGEKKNEDSDPPIEPAPVP